MVLGSRSFLAVGRRVLVCRPIRRCAGKPTVSFSGGVAASPVMPNENLCSQFVPYVKDSSRSGLISRLSRWSVDNGGCLCDVETGSLPKIYETCHWRTVGPLSVIKISGMACRAN